jgi:deoxyribodipyrimidine photo-lyase
MTWTLGSSKTSSKHVNTDRTTFLGSYTSEIAWRDFYTHVMCAFPRTSMGRPYLEKFSEVKWETDGQALERWMQGKTGVPIVDAAMRQANTQGVHD